MRKSLLLAIAIVAGLFVQGQRTEKKVYNISKTGDAVSVLSSYGEYKNGVASKVFSLEVRQAGTFHLGSLLNIQNNAQVKTIVDGITYSQKNTGKTGWQWDDASGSPLSLPPGLHEIRFSVDGAMIPMIEEIYLEQDVSNGRESIPAPVSNFLQNVEVLKQHAVSQDDAPSFTNKVLPNPEGLYNHAIDTTFNYSHFSTIYLAPGGYTFTTSGSTTTRALSIFTPDYTGSWSAANGGAGGESFIYVSVATGGYYNIMLRSLTGSTGTTNIVQNGTTIINNAIIGGRSYAMTASKTGALNFFTCKLTGSAADTRMIVSTYAASSVLGYNDDYYNLNSDFNWGRSSRVKTNTTTPIQYGFVCAYSPTSTGVCDIYLGNANSYAYYSFENLDADDCIQTGAYSDTYNCISWSGGITSSWTWPLEFSSPWYNSDSLKAFDNFYANIPQRYPGAWNYLRTTYSNENAIVDLWAHNGDFYTHGSVRKPGNNHPHGYDWESKPGHLERSLHPRTALNGSSYGSIVRSYKHLGTYAKTANNESGRSFETDADAIEAGFAVADHYTFSSKGETRLHELTSKINASTASRFRTLYEAWKNTWKQNEMQSSSAMYCKNSEYSALMNFCKENPEVAQVLICKAYLRDGVIVTYALQELTQKKYGHLMTRIIEDYKSNVYNKDGRFIVSNQYLNGVRYIDQLLPSLEIPREETPVAAAEPLITIAPNPVSDQFTVQFNIPKAQKVSVQATSMQTRKTIILQQEKLLEAGNHQFSGRVADLAGSNGDIIVVTVITSGVTKTMKVLVAR